MTSKQRVLELCRELSFKSFDIKTNNCIQFTNKCWEIYHGKPWCPQYLDKQSIYETGWTDTPSLIDTLLHRTTEPKEGDLVLVKCGQDNYLNGYLAGFCIGDLSAFLGEKGIKYLPTKKLKLSWCEKDQLELF